MGVTSLACPAISTGIYGYPAAAAAGIAVKNVLDADIPVERICFVCFDDATRRLYDEALDHHQ